MQAGRQACRQACRQAGRQAGRQAARSAARQLGGQPARGSHADNPVQPISLPKFALYSENFQGLNFRRLPLLRVISHPQRRKLDQRLGNHRPDVSRGSGHTPNLPAKIIA